MKKLLLFCTLSLFVFHGFTQAVVNALNHNTDSQDTYQSTCVGADGSFYAASSYGTAHSFQGEIINKLNPNAFQEVLVIKYLNDGSLDWKRRITITANNAAVGKIEFMAVDANGYLYLSTQGTSSGPFLKIEDDSLAMSGVGNRVIQLYPNGKLRSFRSFNNQIHNICAHGDYVYVTGLTNFNGPHIAKYDSLFSEPNWISQGSSSFFLGASAFDRLQMNCSPSGEFITFLSIDAGQNLSWGGNDIGQQSSQNFDELVAVVIDSTGAFQFAKTFISSSALNPLSIAVDDDANIYMGGYTTGSTNVAGIQYGPESGFLSNHTLIIKVNNLGIEEWAVQCSAVSTAPRFEGLNIDLDGNLLFAGSGGGNININSETVLSLSQRQPFAGKINESGELEWVVGATEVENNCRFFRIYPIQENKYIVSAQSMLAAAFQCYDEINGDLNFNHFIALIDALEALPITANPSFNANFLEVVFESNAVNGTSYLWNFDDGLTSEEMNPMHSFNTPGVYNVTLTVSNCQFDETFEIVVEVEEEIIQSVSHTNFEVFSAFFASDNVLQLKGNSYGNIKLYDAMGRLVYVQNNIKLPTQLLLPQLSDGMYHVIFSTKEEDISRKIIYSN